MSQQSLLFRCKKTIQTLNDVIDSQKKEIDRLHTQNKDLNHYINQCQSQKIDLMQELSVLKQKTAQNKADKLTQLHKLENLLIDAAGEVQNHKLNSISLEKRVKLYQQELEERNEKQHKLSVRWEQQMKTLKDRLLQIEMQNLNILNERNQLFQQIKLIKKYSYQQNLKISDRNIHQLDLNTHKILNQNQEQILSYRFQINKYLKIISLLEEQKAEFLRILSQQRILLQQYSRAPNLQGQKTHYPEEATKRTRIQPSLKIKQKDVSKKGDSHPKKFKKHNVRV